MLLRNKSGQGIYLYAYTIATGAALAGDAANIGGFYSLDNGAEASLATAHPAEIGHGAYWQPLAQAETDGAAYAYSWASSTSGVAVRPEAGFTGAVQLADGVAHGGTPGSSTATLAMESLRLKNSAAVPAFLVESSGESAVRFQSGADGQDGLQLIGNGASDSAGLYCQGNINGAYFYAAVSGTALKIEATDGDGIQVIAVGTGKKALLLSGDAATDSLAIAAGAGSPVDVFDAAAGVRLSADGLDSITDTEVSAVPANFREMLRWLFQRFGGKADKTLTAGTGTVVVKTAAGATATTQAIADDGAGSQTQGLAS